jgi:hypothetical protein
MCLSRSDSGLIEGTQRPLGDAAYIRISADLLQQMFSELQTLATSNSRLSRAMAGREWHAQDRLWTLHETADKLLRVNDHSVTTSLKCRAIALIASLSDEFDELMPCVVVDA